MKYLRRLITVFWVTMPFTFSLSAAEADFSQVKASFSEAVQRENQQTEAKVKSLKENYANYLAGLAAQYQQSGKLDAVLWLQQEQAGLRKGGDLPELTGEETAETKEIRLKYVDAKQSILDQNVTKVRSLYDRYEVYLENQISHLTRTNKIGDAQLAQDELKKAMASKPKDPEMVKVIRAAKGMHYLGCVVRASPNHYTYLIRNGKEEDRKIVAAKLEGRAKIVNDRDLRLDGGRARFPNVGSGMSAGIIHKGAFRFVIEFTVDGLDQKGPATIFAISNGAGQENLVLSQQHDNLVLYLRTSENAVLNPDSLIDLGKVENGIPTRLALSFGGGEFWAYRDGVMLKTPSLKGDLDNWCLAEVILGDLPEGGHGWTGSVAAFDLMNKYEPKRRADMVSAVLGRHRKNN